MIRESMDWMQWDDIEELARKEGVTHIVSMQEESNQRDWSVNPEEIARACQHYGVQLIRVPTRDHSLSIHQQGWRVSPANT